MTTKSILLKFLNGLFRNKWKFFLSSSIMFSVIVFGVWVLDPQFDGVTIIQLKNGRSPVSFDENSTIPLGNSLGKLNTLVGITQGPAMAYRVVDKTGFDKTYQESIENPDTRGAVRQNIMSIVTSPITLAKMLGILEDKPPVYRDKAANALRTNLLLASVGEGSDLITITISAKQPSLSNKLSNAYAEELMATNAEIVREKYKQMRSSLLLRMKEGSADLSSKERALLEYKRVNDLSDITAERMAKLNEISGLETSIQLAEQKIEELGKTKQSLERSLAGADNTKSESSKTNSQTSIENESDIVALNDQLESLQAQLNTSRTELNAAEIAVLEKQIDDTQDMINNLIISLTTSSQTTSSSDASDPLFLRPEEIDSQVAGTEAALSVMRSQLSASKAQLGPMTELEIELSRLERDRSISEQRFAEMVRNLKQIDELVKDPVSDLELHIVDKSDLPNSAEPSFPSWPLVIIIGGFFSVSLSLFILLVLEYFNNKVFLGSELENELGLRVLGNVEHK